MATADNVTAPRRAAGPDGEATYGVMEGEGAYNKHAKLQAAGAASALPLLEKAALGIALEPGDRPIVIADYGSSQGKNSLAPMRVAIQTLRGRLGPNRPISVFHIDQPANDFNTLFEVLDADPDRYVLNQPNVFPYAIGRSFYGTVLPPDTVHLAWSSYAVVWLSRTPTAIPDHFYIPSSTGAVRAEFDRQGARDWEAFLSLRAAELRPGARLVVLTPALHDDGSAPIVALMDHANAVLAEMADEAEVTVDERRRMILGVFPRRKRDLLAPFTHDERFQGLVVEHCGTTVIADGAWAEHQRHADADLLAAKQATFFRATFVPTLAAALAPSRGPQGRRAFSDRLEDGLKRRLASQPAPLQQHLIATIVLAKQGPP